MIEFGKSLRAARETKGYTIVQLAEITHLAPSTITELESEDFSRIAAPIYGRGFVKLYCEAVGLEPKPLVEEFMNIFNGNRDTEIRERPVSSEPAPAPTEEPAAEPVPEPEPIAESEPTPEPNLFQQEEPVIAPAPTEEASGQGTLSRYATPLRERDQPSLPSSTWRICIVGAAALAILILVIYGLRAVYRATSPAEDSDDAPAVQEQPAAKPATPKAERAAQKIPSLYID